MDRNETVALQELGLTAAKRPSNRLTNTLQQEVFFILVLFEDSGWCSTKALEHNLLFPLNP
jgi:hypothetical protein